MGSYGLPITFYDFQATHPDFEAGHTLGLESGMVANNLGSDGKPVCLGGTYIPDCTRFSKWFSADTDVRRLRTYSPTRWPRTEISHKAVNPSPRSLRLQPLCAPQPASPVNIELSDAITFKLDTPSSGSIEFDSATGGGFFLIDSKGFGNTPAQSVCTPHSFLPRSLSAPCPTLVTHRPL
jgi:hypothetical protein